METLANSTDEKARKKAAAEINKNDIVLSAKGELGMPKASPKTPPAAETPKGPKPGDITKKDAAAKGLVKKGDKPEETDARIKKVNEEKDKIDTALKNTDAVEKREGLQAGLKAIAAASKEAGGSGDVAAVKKVLGDAKYNEIDAALKAQGGAAAVLTPPAPAPATPAATPAPQGSAPAPQQPPAAPAAPARTSAADKPVDISVAASMQATVSQPGAAGGDTGALPKIEGTPGNLASAKPIDVKKGPDKPTV